MGLDQYAYTITPETGVEGNSPAFQWRKHAKLQMFMETLFVTRTGRPAADLNCGELRLTAEDIETLKARIEGDDLPISGGGFFYGHQAQGETEAYYKTQDLAFCHWAAEQMSDGHDVAYSCWW